MFPLQERVQHGVMPELVELARIQGVKGYRARQLFNAGLRTIKDVAESDPSTLEAIFNRGEHYTSKFLATRQANYPLFTIICLVGMNLHALHWKHH